MKRDRDIRIALTWVAWTAFGALATDPLLAVADSVDPRPALIELARAGRGRDALAVVERELAERPTESKALGFQHLRGHLLEELNQPALASKAYIDALSGPAKIAAYSRYRVALGQERAGHPEVAAGLLASLVAAVDLGPELLPRAVRLFERSLARGGDCHLLTGIDTNRFAPPERRALGFAQAQCALRQGERDLGRTLLARLLAESEADDWALAAAERASLLDAPPVAGRLALLAGRTLLAAGDPERASRMLNRVQEQGTLARKDRWEVNLAAERARLAMGRAAALAQGVFRLVAIAERAPSAELRAVVLSERAEAIERLGQLRPASLAWRAVRDAQPEGRLAASSLLAALRLDERRGDRTQAEAALAQLAARRESRFEGATGELFLAVSDLARGRTAGIRPRLTTAGAQSTLAPFVSYWRGRAAELERRGSDAVTNYLEVIRRDPYDPMAVAARRRLTAPALAPNAVILGQRLSASRRTRDLVDAWLLLGESNPLGRTVRAALARKLVADRETSPFLRLARTPTARWPLWSRARPAATGEEALLALGLWSDGAPAASDLFARGEADLAFTAALELGRAGQVRRSIAMAQGVRDRVPDRLPTALLPPAFRKTLYPLPFADLVRREARRRDVDPLLLAAILRQASGFDPQAVRGMGRGLAALTPAVARRLAARSGMDFAEADDLFRPEISIALAAARLGEISRETGGIPHRMISAWIASPTSPGGPAGIERVRLWQSACATPEPEEFWSLLPDARVRELGRAIAADWLHYRELYPSAPKP